MDRSYMLCWIGPVTIKTVFFAMTSYNLKGCCPHILIQRLLYRCSAQHQLAALLLDQPCNSTPNMSFLYSAGVACLILHTDADMGHFMQQLMCC